MSTTTSEVCELLREATKVFDSSEDVEAIAQAARVYKETRDMWSQAHTDARDLIRDWTEKVSARETAVLAAQNDDEHKRTVSLLETEKDSTIAQWSANEKTCEQLSSKVQKMKAELEDLKAKLAAAEATPVDLVPKQKHAISLYTMLTSIRWDYEHESLVQGQVMRGSEGSKEVRDFSLDPAQQSKFFITNYLWDNVVSCK